MIKNPCNKCKIRTEDCHPTCWDYFIYRKKVDARNKERQKEANVTDTLVTGGQVRQKKNEKVTIFQTHRR